MSVHLLLNYRGEITFLGDPTGKVLGYSSIDIAQTPVFELLKTNQTASQIRTFIKVPASETLVIHRVQIKTKHRGWKWFEMSLTHLPYVQPDAGIMVNLTDVDNVIDDQFIKDKISSDYASLFALHPFGIMQLSPDAEVKMINPQLHADLGYELIDLQNRPLLSLVLPQYRHKVLLRYMHARRNAEASTFDIQVYDADRISVYVNFTIVPVVHQTHITELYLVIKDISYRIALQENLKRLSIVANKTTNGVAILDGQFTVEWVNDGFCQMSGYTAAEAIGELIGELLNIEQSGTDLAEQFREMIKAGRSLEQEVICYRKDGSSFWNLLKVTPIINKAGVMERCITIHDDITEKKKAELDLRLLAEDLYKQNKELHQFAYIVSHNLRSPVSNILGLANLLETFKDDAETQTQALAELSRSVNNLDAVIHDLSYILTIRDGSKEVFKEPVNLHNLLEQILADMHPTISSADALVTLPAKSLVMRTNRAYIYSIFYNLISNAIKYRSQLKPYIKIDYYNTNEHTVIYVADNGRGIDIKKHANDLFKPYKRFDLRAEGKGLGLFLVKSHIEAMGGELSVKSELHKGSTFYIKIPLN
jgi:PAS domain S-box-containing protein